MTVTVQELIDALNKVENKSKEVIYDDYFEIEEIIEHDSYVTLY